MLAQAEPLVTGTSVTWHVEDPGGHLDGVRLWTDFDLGDQWIYILVAGLGVGLVLSPASTDALNRVPRNMYGEATGITDWVNFLQAGGSLEAATAGFYASAEFSARVGLNTAFVTQLYADAGPD